MELSREDADVHDTIQGRVRNTQLRLELNAEGQFRHGGDHGRLIRAVLEVGLLHVVGHFCRVARDVVDVGADFDLRALALREGPFRSKLEIIAQWQTQLDHNTVSRLLAALLDSAQVVLELLERERRPEVE